MCELESASPALFGIRTKLGDDLFLRFMPNTAAVHLSDPAFTDSLQAWLAVLGSAGFVTFICLRVYAFMHKCANSRNSRELAEKKLKICLRVNDIGISELLLFSGYVGDPEAARSFFWVGEAGRSERQKTLPRKESNCRCHLDVV
jgi:hypothetical protein